MTKLLYYVAHYDHVSTLYTEDGKHWLPIVDFMSQHTDEQLHDMVVYQVIDTGEGECVYCTNIHNAHFNVGKV